MSNSSNSDLLEHTHDIHTVHIILDGELLITEGDRTLRYRSGIESISKQGQGHKARGATDSGVMIVGKKAK